MDKIKKQLKGFSTAVDSSTNRSYQLVDYELAKRDLLNAFHTRKGERLMYPLLGTIIWDYVMEPLTSSNKDLIYYDVINIVNQDNRFSFISCTISEIDYGLTITMDLLYVPTESVEQFKIDFEDRNTSRSSNGY